MGYYSEMKIETNMMSYPHSIVQLLPTITSIPIINKPSKIRSFPNLKINCLFHGNGKQITNYDHHNNHDLLDPIIRPTVEETTLGRHVSRRLKEVGVTDVFTVPGDSNLVLLDHIMAEPGMNLIGCCNELNAGYAADGYARSRGVGACIFTFTVGGLSAINAIAGAFSENVPIICIVGALNTNYYGSNLDLHHTVSPILDFSEEFSCFKHVTCHQVLVNRLEDAQEKIDEAITVAIEQSKPVYISISCNLAKVSVVSKHHIPLFFSPRFSNPLSLDAAVEEAAEVLNRAVKPVLVAGPGIRTSNARDAFLNLANASGYAVAFLPTSKGIVPVNHPHFAGCYWGGISSPACMETVDKSDATLFVGAIFDDISTGGYSMSYVKETAIMANETNVAFGNGAGKFAGVMMRDFLEELAKKLKMNSRSYEDYCWRNMTKEGGSDQLVVESTTHRGFIKTRVLYEHIQKMLSDETLVVADVGDSWFHCENLILPQGCGFEIQMHYASLGWSVGATLGLAQAAPDKRVIACMGDGAFQMTGQEVSSMVRNGHRSIIFVINNGGYGIESQIHDGSYNVLKNWDYSGFVDALHNGEGKCWTAKVRCEEELVKAIGMAMGEKKNCLCFIEVIVPPSDLCNQALQLGTFIGTSNSTPPSFTSSGI